MSSRPSLLLALCLLCLVLSRAKGSLDTFGEDSSAIGPAVAIEAKQLILNTSTILSALEILEGVNKTAHEEWTPGTSAQVVFLPNGSIALQQGTTPKEQNDEGLDSSDDDGKDDGEGEYIRHGLPSGREAPSPSPHVSSAVVSRSSDGEQIIITLNPTPPPSPDGYLADLENSQAADARVPVLGGVGSFANAGLGETPSPPAPAVKAPETSTKESDAPRTELNSSAYELVPWAEEDHSAEPEGEEERPQKGKKPPVSPVFAGVLGGLVGFIVLVILPIMIWLIRRQRRLRRLSSESGSPGGGSSRDLEAGLTSGAKSSKILSSGSGSSSIMALLPRLALRRPGHQGSYTSPFLQLAHRTPSAANGEVRPKDNMEDVRPDGHVSDDDDRTVAVSLPQQHDQEEQLDNNNDDEQSSSEQQQHQSPSGGGRSPILGSGSSDLVWPRPPPWTDGRISPDEISIVLRPDGSPWLLGSGAYGTVYKALRDGVQPVAVKVIGGMEAGRRRDEFIREVTLLRSCRDRNIVQFIGACIRDDEAMLVTEFMDLGDLWRAATLRNPRGERIFGWYARGRKVLLDVARGLHFLHSRSIVHLDLKSANILLARDGTAKVADVGFARVISKSYLPSSVSGLGTFAWSAPEVLFGDRCGPKSDIYSFGIVLWEVCTGETPLRGDMRPIRVPEEGPQEVVELYEACTASDPAARPDTRTLVHTIEGLLSTNMETAPSGFAELQASVAAGNATGKAAAQEQ